MPEADKVINCAVCGVEVQVQRLSARYCKDCKPKAAVLNAVIRNLTRLLNVEPGSFGVLMGTSTPVSDRLMDAFPALEALVSYNLLDVLNVALSDYGRIEFTGTEFRIQPTSEQRTVRMGGFQHLIQSGTILNPAGLIRPADWQENHRIEPPVDSEDEEFDVGMEGGDMAAFAVFQRLRAARGQTRNTRGNNARGGIDISNYEPASGSGGSETDNSPDGVAGEVVAPGLSHSAGATRPRTLLEQQEILGRFRDTGNLRHF